MLVRCGWVSPCRVWQEIDTARVRTTGRRIRGVPRGGPDGADAGGGTQNPAAGCGVPGDAAAVVALLSDRRWPRDALQLIGDGLIAAVGRRVPDAAALARACVVELRDRGWDGDDELADQLDGLLGAGPVPLLRPLPVDLEELAGVLEGDPLSGNGRLDLHTGRGVAGGGDRVRPGNR